MTKSHATGWDADSPTPAQFTEFFNQVEKRRISKNRLQGLLNEDLAIKDSDKRYARARKGLYEDLVSPQELKNIGEEYSPAALEHFAQTIPNTEILLWCMANNCLLIPGPPKPITFCELLESNARLLMDDIAIYCHKDSDIDLVFRDVTRTGWIIMSKKILPSSCKKNLLDQIQHLSGPERLPGAADVLWAIINFKKIRGHRLLNGQSVRTATRINDRKSIVLGPFSYDGLYVDALEDDLENEALGILVSR